ncbi:MAG: sulfotransferase domain-containing protein [Leptolyngbya sp. SIO3F4]|nr:sulfotransferase domain-containing protein [Leptolyngbya sp. SIO3F4]
MKKRVIICGYPKSGNTWLTRLTAQILNCPVVGFWCQPFNKEEAIEGEERKSDYQCFKAHHTQELLQQTLNVYGNGTEKIIYIYRDPRAVLVSASHYFSLQPRYPQIRSILTGLPLGLRLYYKYLHTHSYKLDVLMKGFVHGTEQGSWLQEPWSQHVKGYMTRNDILFISYESLKENSLQIANKISDFLSVERSTEELEHAIEVQSFDKKKKKFEDEGKQKKASFLREGSISAWKSELQLHHISYIEQNLAPIMHELGYTLETNVKQDAPY